MAEPDIWGSQGGNPAAGVCGRGRGTDEQISPGQAPGSGRSLLQAHRKKFSASGLDGVAQNVSPGGKDCTHTGTRPTHDARHPHAHVCAQISGYGVGEVEMSLVHSSKWKIISISEITSLAGYWTC